MPQSTSRSNPSTAASRSSEPIYAVAPSGKRGTGMQRAPCPPSSTAKPKRTTPRRQTDATTESAEQLLTKGELARIRPPRHSPNKRAHIPIASSACSRARSAPAGTPHRALAEPRPARHHRSGQDPRARERSVPAGAAAPEPDPRRAPTTMFSVCAPGSNFQRRSPLMRRRASG